MSFLFKECSSLKDIPDISKWKLNENVNINEMFKLCISLVNIPKMNFNSFTNNIKIFDQCLSLLSFPEITN